MSIVLKPSMDAMVAIRCTSAAALAVCRAIEDVCNISTQIKWVNDIIVNNKKVCGILTEGMAGLETGKIEYVILGIGVNVSTAPASFPPDVAQVATSLYDGVLPKGITRNRLIASITDHVLEIMEEVSSMNFLGEYRQRSIVLNREVEVSQGSVNYRAVATDIDDEGALVVRLRDGSLRRLNSGEITLRPAGSEHW
jgi:BirA family biotin operon repressor/biotin-[acetyl-CoA-carboxylase] ligase